MNQNSFFVEGLQGAVKSTFVNRLSEKLSDFKVFREGDHSPVELAWCAYVTEQQYQDVLAKYPSLRTEIAEKTLTERTHKIICYSQILTDIPKACSEKGVSFAIPQITAPAVPQDTQAPAPEPVAISIPIIAG